MKYFTYHIFHQSVAMANFTTHLSGMYSRVTFIVRGGSINLGIRSGSYLEESGIKAFLRTLALVLICVAMLSMCVHIMHNVVL